jgi:hypothetical protein
MNHTPQISLYTILRHYEETCSYAAVFYTTVSFFRFDWLVFVDSITTVPSICTRTSIVNIVVTKTDLVNTVVKY